jgi:hypothetical protein
MRKAVLLGLMPLAVVSVFYYLRSGEDKVAHRDVLGCHMRQALSPRSALFEILSHPVPGLGSAVVVDGIVEPMELGHLPCTYIYRQATFEHYVGVRRPEKHGKKK